jgi:hypothetical protein
MFSRNAFQDSKIRLPGNTGKYLLAVYGAETAQRHFPHAAFETGLPDLTVGFARGGAQLLIDIVRQVNFLDKFGYRHRAFWAERTVVHRREDFLSERSHTRFSPILIAVRYV